MKHTLLTGLAALTTVTTIMGAEPKSSTPKPDTPRAVCPQNLGREFITNAKFGIFVHYTVEYAHLLGKPQPAVWDLDAKANAFDVKAFADAVEGMGAQYVTLTAFHAAMYLLVPSKAMVDAGMSKHQAKRDLLGEVADELNKRGIALCLYVHPTDQHDLSQQERALFGWGPEVNGLPGEKLGLWPNPKWDPVDTVIVLKVGPAFEPGVVLSENAKLEISSTCGHDVATNHARLFSGDTVPFAFHTDNEKNPWAKIDLGSVRAVRTVEIENRQREEERTKGLIMSISEDGQKWEDVWQAKSWVTTWIARVTQSSAGTVQSGRKARFIKLETRGDSIRPLVLRRVTVFGVK